MSLRLIVAAAISFLGLLTATPAAAQATRTWVSGVGDDVNPCSRTAPCKTFAGAISKTATGGEINCLDPGGYGAVTIVKSITIDCTGTLGSILASASNGVIVNGAGITVTLRNISINGAPPANPGLNGIRILNAALVNVEGVTIENFRSTAAGNGFGINLLPTGVQTRLFVTNSLIRNNGGASNGGGINIQPGSGGIAQVHVSNTELSNNTFRGINVTNTGTAANSGNLTVSNSSIFSTAQDAINATTSTNTFSIMVDGVVMANNNKGLVLTGSGIDARIGGSTITDNGIGVQLSGSPNLLSFKNNQIALNGTDGTPIPQANLE